MQPAFLSTDKNAVIFYSAGLNFLLSASQASLQMPPVTVGFLPHLGTFSVTSMLNEEV